MAFAEEESSSNTQGRSKRRSDAMEEDIRESESVLERN